MVFEHIWRDPDFNINNGKQWNPFADNITAQDMNYIVSNLNYVADNIGAFTENAEEAVRIASDASNLSIQASEKVNIAVNASNEALQKANTADINSAEAVAKVSEVLEEIKDIPELNVDEKIAAVEEKIPKEYVKDATVSDDTLTITKQDGTTVEFQGGGDLSGYVPITRTINGKALSSNISLGNKDIGALPDYTITISHQSAGNPRMVKFVSVNYASKATCFKMAAMTCHDNGVSYQFLTDMLIAVTAAGEVTANIYKFAQSSIGNVDGVARYTGDVFYVNDETNKIIDFYILCGQWSSSQFTPVTKVGSTTIDYVTQYSGSATYYSSGDKTWVNGCGTTYARLSDLANYFPLSGGAIGANGISWNSESLPQDTAPMYVCTIDGFAVGGRQKWASMDDLKKSLGLNNGVSFGRWSIAQDSSGNLVFKYK